WCYGFDAPSARYSHGSRVHRGRRDATLWIMTAIGLCFGGGQLALRSAATILAVITLWALRALDARIPREHRAIIVVSAFDSSSLSPVEVSTLLGKAGYKARVVRLEEGERITLTFELHWRQFEGRGLPLGVLEFLKENYRVDRFDLRDKGDH